MAEFRNPKRRSDEEIMNAIEAHRGNISAAARVLGYTRPALSNRISNTPELAEHLAHVRETSVDHAESLLWVHIEQKENLQALLEYLKAQGKKRGYGNQSIDMILDAKVNHGVDEAMLEQLLKKFEEGIEDEKG